MPDLVLYLQAMLVAAVASAACVLAVAGIRRPASPRRLNVALVLGIGIGLLVGYRIMHLRLSWPPVKGLDRLLTIVLPAVIGIELIAAVPRVLPWLAWLLRLILVAVNGSILLRGSVYLSDSVNAWTGLEATGVLTASGAILAIVWGQVSCLTNRSWGPSIPLALAMATHAAGLVIMLEGYVTGGAAAFPLVAALVGTTAAATLLSKSTPAQGMIGVGVVCLFGLLFVGRFFGGLTTTVALTIFLAPLMCWVTEIPLINRQSPWLVGTLRLVLVAIPLTVVVVQAKQTFDRETAPLLGISPVREGK